MRKLLDWFATAPRGSFAERRTRLLGALLLTVALCGPALAGDVSGPDPPGQPAAHAPVLVAGKVQPSPQTSPGVVQNVAVTSEGRVQVALPAGSPVPAALTAGNIGVQSNAGGGSVNVTGPATTTATANATATGYATYCSPSFAGGSSEVTVKGSQGVLVALSVSNPNTTDVYWEAWDASNPAPGTTAPDLCFCIPGGIGSTNRAMYDLVLPAPGWSFATAFTSTIVTAANGSSTPGSACTVTLIYK